MPAASRLREGLLWAGLALLTLLPRILDLGQFVTHDEAEFWIRRSELFVQALLAGQPGGTAISPHPGVTTMWLGGTGMLLREWLLQVGVLPTDSFALLLTSMRLPVALLHTAALLGAYALLQRMVWPPIAILAAVFWATDPFLVAYSRLLHVDALLTTGVLLSVLALARWLKPLHDPRWLVLAAAAAAFAVLSKSPGLILLPFTALTVLLMRWHERCPAHFWLAHALREGLLWGGVFVGMLLLLYPALWAAPQRVIELFQQGVATEGLQPHQTGNFFLGQRTEVPGLLHYPVAIAMRLTPLTLIGVLLLPLVWRQAVVRPARPALVLITIFVLLFVLAMSLFAKQFNRYILPIFPLLDILAAVGIGGALAWASASLSQSAARLVQRAGVASLTALAAVNLALWHPYSIAAFNQLLGGAPVGVRLLTAGWGEGYDQVAAWLNQQEDITGVLTVSRMITSLNPYLKPGAQAFFPTQGELRSNAGYLVVYLSEVQGGAPQPPADRFYGHAPPVHVVRLHGVDYAWIYQVPPRTSSVQPARFGELLRLHGCNTEPDTQPVAAGSRLTLTCFWQVQQPTGIDEWLFVHLVDAQGQRIAQLDLPYPTTAWQVGRYTPADIPLDIPATTAAGDYRVVVGWYNPATGARLPLREGPRADPALSGDDALLLATVRVQ